MRLLEQHIAATRLDEVGNFIAMGTFGNVSADRSSGTIVLKARAPNLYKFKTEYLPSGVAVEFGHDGKHTWSKSSQPLSGEVAAQWDYFASIATMEVSLAHLAWSYRSPAAKESGLDTVLELLPPEEWRGRPCAVVRSYGLLPVSMYHYIDTQTYQEVHRRAKIVNEKGVMVEVGIDLDQPDGSLPYGLPMGYHIFVDGELHDAIKYTEFKFNREVMEGLFAPPSDSSLRNLAIRP